MTRDGNAQRRALEKCIWAGHLVVRDETRRHLQPRKNRHKAHRSLLSSHFPLTFSLLPPASSHLRSTTSPGPSSLTSAVTLENFRHERPRHTKPDVELTVTVAEVAGRQDIGPWGSSEPNAEPRRREPRRRSVLDRLAAVVLQK